MEGREYGLAIHTASSELGLAIADFAGDSRYQVWDLGRDTSNLLQEYLLEFLKPQTWKDLAFIAVARGPGGFTGTRIGVVTARTLAQQLAIPVFAVSTLAAIAWDAAQTLAQPKDIAVQMAAQRGEVFGAIYRAETDQETVGSQPECPNVLLPDTVMSLDEWQQTLREWNHPYQLMQVESKLGATVTSVLDLAYLEWHHGKRPHWSAALPFYGQHPVKN